MSFFDRKRIREISYIADQHIDLAAVLGRDGLEFLVDRVPSATSVTAW